MILYDNLHGHHVGYAEFLSSQFKAPMMEYRVGLIFKVLFTKQNVFFSTIDEHLFTIFLLAMFRNIFGAKTSGLYIGATRLRHKTLKSYIKRLLFRLARNFKNVRFISIISFDYLGNESVYFHDYIYDPMFCDLGWNAASETSNWQDRTIIVLGYLTEDKGYSDIFDLLKEHSELYVHHYGSVGLGLGAFDNANINFLSHGAFEAEEIDAILTQHKNSIMWCKFKEKYDLSSGAFGKALQYGIPVFVKDGSYLDHLVKQHDILSISDLSCDKCIIGSLNSNEKFYLTARKRLICVLKELV